MDTKQESKRDAALSERIESLSDPEDLGALLDEIVTPQRDGAYFNPWNAVLQTATERNNAFIGLSKRLGRRYADCSFANYIVTNDKQQSALDRIMDFARHMPKRLRAGGGVTLFGPPGVGKDHLVAALMYYAIFAHGFSVEWCNGLDLYGEIRERIENDDSEQDLVRRYQQPLIFVVSDPIPPKGEVSRYNADVLYRIIDRRYRDCKSTWATMNVDGGDEAEDRLATNLVDRLRHNSLTIHCDWDSHRNAMYPRLKGQR